MDTGARVAIAHLVAALAKTGVIDQPVVDEFFSRLESAARDEQEDVAGLKNKILGLLRQD